MIPSRREIGCPVVRNSPDRNTLADQRRGIRATRRPRQAGGRQRVQPGETPAGFLLYQARLSFQTVTGTIWQGDLSTRHRPTSQSVTAVGEVATPARAGCSRTAMPPITEGAIALFGGVRLMSSRGKQLVVLVGQKKALAIASRTRTRGAFTSVKNPHLWRSG